jgi:hypothetical protein
VFEQVVVLFLTLSSLLSSFVVNAEKGEKEETQRKKNILLSLLSSVRNPSQNHHKIPKSQNPPPACILSKKPYSLRIAQDGDHFG